MSNEALIEEARTIQMNLGGDDKAATDARNVIGDLIKALEQSEWVSPEKGPHRDDPVLAKLTTHYPPYAVVYKNPFMGWTHFESGQPISISGWQPITPPHRGNEHE